MMSVGRDETIFGIVKIIQKPQMQGVIQLEKWNIKPIDL